MGYEIYFCGVLLNHDTRKLKNKKQKRNTYFPDNGGGEKENKS